MTKKTKTVRPGFCIYINTFFQGPVPSVCDGDLNYWIYETEFDAQKEIVDLAQIRLQEFLDKQRDFGDAINVEEYVVAVNVEPNGTFRDKYGKRYSARFDDESAGKS